jgi:mercuric ion transport protein
MKAQKSVIGAGLIAAIASSLCCITPIIAILAGTSSLAGNFSWLEPARPFLIGITILALGYAWYDKLKPAKTANDDCGCVVTTKLPFWKTTQFLGIITTFAIVMTAFPMYANYLIPSSSPRTELFEVKTDNIQRVEFKVKGMTCTGCEGHVKLEVEKLEGIIEVLVSYDKGNTVVKFDKTKTSIKIIEKAINSTGYEVTSYKNLKTK